MSKQVHYCRKGWKAIPLTLVEVDKKSGLCKLANDKGEIVVSDLPYIEDPSKVPVEDFPKSYAAPVDAPAPAKKSRAKGAPAEETGGEGAAGSGEGAAGEGSGDGPAE